MAIVRMRAPTSVVSRRGGEPPRKRSRTCRRQALAELAKAAALDPANARYAYVYGVALYSDGRTGEGLAVLVRASSRHPADTDLLTALASFYRDRGDEAEAQRYTERLRTVAAGL